MTVLLHVNSNPKGIGLTSTSITLSSAYLKHLIEYKECDIFNYIIEIFLEKYVL